MKTTIVIPTYNEKENINTLVRSIKETYPDVRILVVDDNSPDGTAEVVRALNKEFPDVNLLLRKEKNGIGKAYLHGFAEVLKTDSERILQMDADLSHHPKYLQDLFTASEENDVVIGSRYIKGISVINWPLSRVLLSYFANVYVQLITRLPVKDGTGGFKCFHRKVLENIHLEKVKSDGYSFQIEMNYLCWKMGCRIKETPIIFMDRTEGLSKMSKNIILEAMFRVLLFPFMRVKKRLKKARL